MLHLGRKESEPSQACTVSFNNMKHFIKEKVFDNYGKLPTSDTFRLWVHGWSLFFIFDAWFFIIIKALNYNFRKLHTKIFWNVSSVSSAYLEKIYSLLPAVQVGITPKIISLKERSAQLMPAVKRKFRQSLYRMSLLLFISFLKKKRW